MYNPYRMDAMQKIIDRGFDEVRVTFMQSIRIIISTQNEEYSYIKWKEEYYP